eukprot:GDKJ01052360.1.p1 GENE.GDKJ01052360.1~~GDKJ01052360.1.p1  ORF type:complete len:184 (+),score=25.37 GDKJ01052360.1:32-553(+)
MGLTMIGAGVSATLHTFLVYEIIKYAFESSSGCVERALLLVDEQGFKIGSRIVPRMITQGSFIVDQREIVKFVAYDVWKYLFHKTVDRLRFNRSKAVFIIDDSNLLWLNGMSKKSTSAIPFHSLIPSFLAGFVRGALSALQVSCTTEFDENAAPACVITIHVGEEFLSSQQVA